MNNKKGNEFFSTMLAGGVVAALALASSTLGQTELAKLTATDGQASDNFGNAVAISGNHAIVGAIFEDASLSTTNNAGAAYIFRAESGTWVQEAKLVASDRAAGDNFGAAVAISGDIAVVGAWLDSHLAISSGSAYVFRRNDGGTPGDFSDDTWVQEQKLISSDRANTDHFGMAVAIDGNVIAIGADRATVSGAPDGGSVYVFRYNGIVWTQEAKLVASDPADFDSFGDTIAMSGPAIAVGARSNDDAGNSSG